MTWGRLVGVSVVGVISLVVCSGCTAAPAEMPAPGALSFAASDSPERIEPGVYIIRRKSCSTLEVLRVDEIVDIRLCEYTGIANSELAYMRVDDLRDGTARPFPSLHVMGTQFREDFGSWGMAMRAIESGRLTDCAKGVCWPLPEKASRDWAVYRRQSDSGVRVQPAKGHSANRCPHHLGEEGPSAEFVGPNLGKPAPQVSPDPFLGLLSPHVAAAGCPRQTGAQNQGDPREPARGRTGPVSCCATAPDGPREARNSPTNSAEEA